MWTDSGTQDAAGERHGLRPRERGEVELLHRRLNAAYDVQLRRGEAPGDDTGGQLNALTWMLGRWKWTPGMRSPVTMGPPEPQPPDLTRVFEELVYAQDVLDEAAQARRRGQAPSAEPKTLVYATGVVQALSWALGLSEAELVFI